MFVSLEKGSILRSYASLDPTRVINELSSELLVRADFIVCIVTISHKSQSNVATVLTFRHNKPASRRVSPLEIVVEDIQGFLDELIPRHNVSDVFDLLLWEVAAADDFPYILK